MTYEELLNELVDVIKETEENAQIIYTNLEKIGDNVSLNDNVPSHEKNKINELLSNCMGVLQHQDLHRQKIERVINYVCEHNNICKEQFNISPIAKSINDDDNISNDELEELIKQMNA